MAKTKDATKGKGKPAAKALPQKKVKVRQQIKDEGALPIIPSRCNARKRTERRRRYLPSSRRAIPKTQVLAGWSLRWSP